MKYEVVMSELLLNNNRISDLHFFFFFYENCKMAANAKWLVCGVLVWDSHCRRGLLVVATRLTGLAHSYTLTINIIILLFIILRLGLDYYYFNMFVHTLFCFFGNTLFLFFKWVNNHFGIQRLNSWSLGYVKILKF